MRFQVVIIYRRLATRLTCGGGRSSSHLESATLSGYRDAKAGLAADSEIHRGRPFAALLRRAVGPSGAALREGES